MIYSSVFHQQASSYIRTRTRLATTSGECECFTEYCSFTPRYTIPFLSVTCCCSPLLPVTLRSHALKAGLLYLYSIKMHRCSNMLQCGYDLYCTHVLRCSFDVHCVRITHTVSTVQTRQTMIYLMEQTIINLIRRINNYHHISSVHVKMMVNAVC